MNSEFGIVGSKPQTDRASGGWAAFRILNFEFRIPRLLPLLAAVLLVLSSGGAEAELAIFTDGRVLKVADARLDHSHIVLELVGGGTVTVPAVRIDRVIADEVEIPQLRSDFLDPSCPSDWSDQQLPAGLPFRTAIEKAARASDLDPLLVAAVVQTESDFDPKAVSRAGASGLMQLMPAAAADRGVRDVFDPEENLRGGAAHLRVMLDRFGSLTLALAAYNAGATTVNRYGGVPPYRETRNYVRKVLSLFCPTDNSS